ncbi:MAG: hypothetical protein SF187_23155 [Deltaproteobacteria bacterium]|nr:hypothetical protein [Deltaproteobacteria bacterium]
MAHSRVSVMCALAIFVVGSCGDGTETSLVVEVVNGSGMPSDPEALRVFLYGPEGVPLFDDERLPKEGTLQPVSEAELGSIVLHIGDATGRLELNIFAIKDGARIGRGRTMPIAESGQQTVVRVTLMPTQDWPDTEDLLGLGPNGESCSANEQCLSGACVDGVCCGQKQCGTCAACNLRGSVGTCAPVPLGEPDTNAPLPCENEQTCDGEGTCRNSAGHMCRADADCAHGHCIDGLCCSSACTGACEVCSAPGHEGSCVPRPSGSIGGGAGCANGGVCDGAGMCGPRCKVDADCGAGEGCIAGACIRRSVDGALCETSNVCASGNCTDGHCCRTSCGPCMQCTGAGGTCVPRPAGSQDGAPHYTCTGKYSCDGRGTCGRSNGQICSRDTDCATGHCVSGICCNSACGGACQNCGDGTCKSITNAVDPRGCSGSVMCDARGACTKVNGQRCSVSAECASGFCVDGACCNSACNESCFSCGTGTCTLRVNTTDAQCTGGRRCDASGLCR